MKTPTVDDDKPRRENLGATGPAKVSGNAVNKWRDQNKSDDGSYEKEIENIIDRKRGQTPPG
jgi:hypothetical protein